MESVMAATVRDWGAVRGVPRDSPGGFCLPVLNEFPICYVSGSVTFSGALSCCIGAFCEPQSETQYSSQGQTPIRVLP